jgi:hypothetical protein
VGIPGVSQSFQKTMAGQLRRDDNQTSGFAAGMPSRQTTKRLKPAKASGAGIWQRITASNTAFVPLVDPSARLDPWW